MKKLDTICTDFRWRLLFSLMFGLWTQTTVMSFSQEGKDKSPPDHHKPTTTSALEEWESGNRPGPRLVELELKALICPQEGFAVVQQNVFTSQEQLDVSHFPSQWEGKRLSLQMGTKKLPLVHMADQQRQWERSSLPEEHNLWSEEQLKLDFSRAAEWWTASCLSQINDRAMKNPV